MSDLSERKQLQEKGVIKEMKIKQELAMAMLFSINSGVIILAIYYNIVKHQWFNIPTNLILLLTSIYFTVTFLRIVFDKTSRSANLLTDCAEMLMQSTKGVLDWSKELVKKVTNQPEIVLDIVCEDEKYLPRYANPTDACMDLKIKVQLESDDSENKTSCYFLKPNETQVFSTGIKVSIPEDYMMLIYPRSSTGFKLKCMLTNTTGVIDSGYRDEVKLAITNFGSETVCLKDAQRIAQFMIIPRPYVYLNLVCDDENFRYGDRNGGIGSTGE